MNANVTVVDLIPAWVLQRAVLGSISYTYLFTYFIFLKQTPFYKSNYLSTNIIIILQGQLENAKELLSIMYEDKIEPNAQTFAAIFECIERSNLFDKHSILDYYNKQMEEKV